MPGLKPDIADRDRGPAFAGARKLKRQIMACRAFSQKNMILTWSNTALVRAIAFVRWLRVGARIRLRGALNLDISEVDKWLWHRGDQKHLLDHSLKQADVVLEIGGYLGNWSSALTKQNKCKLIIFEPVKAFCQVLEVRFKDHNNVEICSYGLSDSDGTVIVRVAGDASTAIADRRIPRTSITETIVVRDIATVFREKSLNDVALVQMNIEGAEYDLLIHMLKHDLIRKCAFLQIQFHLIGPESLSKRESIRSSLSETHTLEYDYPFVWEAWRRKQEATDVRS